MGVGRACRNRRHPSRAPDRLSPAVNGANLLTPQILWLKFALLLRNRKISFQVIDRTAEAPKIRACARAEPYRDMAQYREYQHWYWRERWRKRAKLQLRLHPLCALCLEHGIPKPATVCDHVEPHKGDWNSFILGPVQSLCKSCHDGSKRMVELRGYDTAIGVDGAPLDPRHPVYQRREPS